MYVFMAVAWPIGLCVIALRDTCVRCYLRCDCMLTMQRLPAILIEELHAHIYLKVRYYCWNQCTATHCPQLQIKVDC